MEFSVTIYANHFEKEVLSEEEYNERLAEVLEDYEKESEGILAEWLDENFDKIDIWNMTAERRQETENQFKAYLKKRAKEAMEEDGWQSYILHL